MAEEENVQKTGKKKVNGMISHFEQKIADNDYKPKIPLKRSKTFSTPSTKPDKTVTISEEQQLIKKSDLENTENESKALENQILAETNNKSKIPLKRSKTFSTPSTTSEKAVTIPEEQQLINENDLENTENELNALEKQIIEETHNNKQSHLKDSKKNLTPLTKSEKAITIPTEQLISKVDLENTENELNPESHLKHSEKISAPLTKPEKAITIPKEQLISKDDIENTEHELNPESHLKHSKKISTPLTKSEKGITIPEEPKLININDLEKIEHEMIVLEDKFCKHKSYSREDYTKFQMELFRFLDEIAYIGSNDAENILKSKNILIYTIENCIQILTRKAPRSEDSEKLVPKPSENNDVTEIYSSIKKLRKLFENTGLKQNKRRESEIVSKLSKQENVGATDKNCEDHSDTTIIVSTADINIDKDHKETVGNDKDRNMNLEINTKTEKPIAKKRIVMEKSVPIKETSKVSLDKEVLLKPAVLEQLLKDITEEKDLETEKKAESENKPIFKEEIVMKKSAPIKETSKVSVNKEKFVEPAVLEQPLEDIKVQEYQRSSSSTGSSTSVLGELVQEVEQLKKKIKLKGMLRFVKDLNSKISTDMNPTDKAITFLKVIDNIGSYDI